MMSERDPLTRLLGTPGADAGCEGALALLAEYVEGELEGRNVRERLPALDEHLRNCPACAEDYEGLVALAREHRAGS
jgi:predicted anti-sigma-YlaC factor YlaD